MTEQENTPGRFGRWLWGVGIALTLAMLYIWLSNENVETYEFVHDGGEVSVQKGVYAPWGHAPFRPTEAFAPIRVDSDLAVRPGPCADQAECEARLYDLAVKQARRLLGRPDQLAAARDLITQARKLSGRGHEEELLELQGDEQYALGVGRLEEVGRLLGMARRNFARAKAMDAGTFRDGHERVRSVDALLAELRAAGIRVPDTPEARGPAVQALPPRTPAVPERAPEPAAPRAAPPGPNPMDVQPPAQTAPAPNPVRPNADPQPQPEASPVPKDPELEL